MNYLFSATTRRVILELPFKRVWFKNILPSLSQQQPGNKEEDKRFIYIDNCRHSKTYVHNMNPAIYNQVKSRSHQKRYSKIISCVFFPSRLRPWKFLPQKPENNFKNRTGIVPDLNTFKRANILSYTYQLFSFDMIYLPNERPY